jgi:hypothetical protein
MWTSTGWQVKHGHVFFGTFGKSDFSVYMCTVAYTEEVTIYKVPEKQGNVWLVTQSRKQVDMFSAYDSLTLNQDIQSNGRQTIAFI